MKFKNTILPTLLLIFSKILNICKERLLVRFVLELTSVFLSLPGL